MRGARLGVLALACGLAVCLAAPQPARAASAVGEVVGGAGDIIAGALALPLNVLVGTFTGPPVVGTVQGVFNGAFQTLGLAGRGAFRMVRGTVPMVMKILPIAALGAI